MKLLHSSLGYGVITIFLLISQFTPCEGGATVLTHSLIQGSPCVLVVDDVQVGTNRIDSARLGSVSVPVQVKKVGTNLLLSLIPGELIGEFRPALELGDGSLLVADSNCKYERALSIDFLKSLGIVIATGASGMLFAFGNEGVGYFRREQRKRFEVRLRLDTMLRRRQRLIHLRQRNIDELPGLSEKDDSELALYIVKLGLFDTLIEANRIVNRWKVGTYQVDEAINGLNESLVLVGYSKSRFTFK